MDVTREDVLHCAALTRLHLLEAEIEPLRRDLESVLSHAQNLAELDLEGVEPDFHGLDPALLRRPDAPSPRRPDVCHVPSTQAEALANAPRTERGHFIVPRAIDQGP
jgi:aspartyl-tRNA(Asn)/glutamyl-tRNA(Gln) amidotransferase subunit C